MLRFDNRLSIGMKWMQTPINGRAGHDGLRAQGMDESGNSGLLANSDPHIQEVVKAAREELVLRKRPHGSASAKLESVTRGKKEVDGVVSPSDVGFRQRIAIKAKRRILFINIGDLIAVEAQGNYALLFHSSGSYRLRESISAIEKKLSLHGFVRIHRSVLVNAALVEEIHPWPTGDYALRVRGGREFTVTRTYKKNLQLLAQSWIGMEGFAVD